MSVFDGQEFKRAILAGQAWLEEHRDAINALKHGAYNASRDPSHRGRR